MNREDIIRMAREAGFFVNEKAREHQPNCISHTYHMIDPQLERFAALVAEHIRETEFKPDWNNYNQGRKDGAEEEREACAKVCEDMKEDCGKHAYAFAIRARGETTLRGQA